MGKQTEQTVVRRRSSNGLQIHEEMFNVLSHKGNANQNYTNISSHPSQMAIIKKINNKCLQGCGGKRNPYTVGGNVN
jgi:hypothetical protein